MVSPKVLPLSVKTSLMLIPAEMEYAAVIDAVKPEEVETAAPVSWVTGPPLALAKKPGHNRRLSMKQHWTTAADRSRHYAETSVSC